MPLDTLENTLVHELTDLLSAEKQFAKALQTVAKNADDSGLRTMAEEHRAETLQHADNLMQAFAALGAKPERGLVCEAAKGLVEEASSTLKDEKPKGMIKDIVLMGGSLRIEHYEIAGYTAAIALARSLGKRNVVPLLQANLKQEQATAKKLQDASVYALSVAVQSETDGASPQANGSAPAANGRKTAAKKAPARKSATNGRRKAAK